MQDINKNILNRQFVNYFELEKISKPVLESIPYPFGSLEKAKYIMYRYGNDYPIYFFTTTIHNLEECIEIMKQKFLELKMVEVYCKIFRIQNGVKELIYTDKPKWKP